MQSPTSRRPIIRRLVAAYKRLLKRLIDPYMREHQILATRFEAGEKRLDFLENWMNHHANRRLDNAEKGLDELIELGDELVKRMDSITVLLNRRQEEIEKRQEGIEGRQEGIDRIQEETDYKYKSLFNRVETLRYRFDTIVDAGLKGVHPLEAPGNSTEELEKNCFDFPGFEKRFRGTREEVKKRQAVYLPVFSDNSPVGRVVDVKCGRGEFMELLREKGIEATGVDSNPSMVSCCRDLGLECAESEAMDFLHAQRDDSLGGIVAFQFIEHLSTGSLIEFVGLCSRKLLPGGYLILETPNPTCPTVFSGAFYVDPTHTRPVNPEFIKFVAESSGLAVEDTWFLNSPEEKLSMVECPADRSTEGLLNDNFARLNSFLYSAPDYAIIAKKV